MEVIDLSMLSSGEMVGTKVGLNGLKRKRKERKWSKSTLSEVLQKMRVEKRGGF